MTKNKQIKIISEHLQAAGDTLNETYMTAAISGALKEIRKLEAQRKDDLINLFATYKKAIFQNIASDIQYHYEKQIYLKKEI